MRSYPLHIAGRDEPADRWTYVAHADAMIRDARRTFAVKRALELGREVDEGDRAVIAGRCAVGTDEQNLRAIDAAAEAARAYGRFSLPARRAIGCGFNERLRACREELIAVLVAEGHPMRLARWEVDGMIDVTGRESVDWAFGQISQRFSDPNREMLLTRKPDGVVCINPPQNAAGGNSSLGLMALLAGNALVVKAPKTCPLGVMYFFREIVVPVLEEHGAPPGTINLVSGYSKRILRAWVESPRVDDIMYFGESTAGLRLGQDCVARGKKPILELSGNDAFVVWRDADLDAAAETLIEAFYGSGQICMLPKQAVLHPAIAEAFADRFLARVGELRPRELRDPEALLSPVLKVDRFFDFIADAREHGCPVLCGGERIDLAGRPALDGAFLEPTVIEVRGLRRARELRCVREEAFCPLLPLIVADDVAAEADDDGALLDELIDWINANPYGLRNSLWAGDEAVIERFAHEVRNGGLLKINDSHIGFVRYLGTHGGAGLTGGPFGELHYPLFRTARLQGISYGRRAPAPVEIPSPHLVVEPAR